MLLRGKKLNNTQSIITALILSFLTTYYLQPEAFTAIFASGFFY